MATAGGIRAGRAFVEIGARDGALVKGLRRAQRRLETFGASVATIGTRIAAVTTAVFAPIGLASLKSASDAQETLSRFEQVFATQGEAAKRFADELARAVGRSRTDILDALSTFQSFFVGLGFDSGQSRELSETLQRLAIDFASFNNLSDEEAVQRFIAALSGSGEVLDRFGVNIKQAALEQELLRQGIAKSFREVSEQEKAIARLAIIMRAMTDQGAVGDAVRTSDSFANRMKALKGQIKDTAAAIGSALIPVVTPIVEKATAVLTVVRAWIEANGKLVASIFRVGAIVASVGVSLIVLGASVAALGLVLGGLATIVTTVGGALGVMTVALGAIVSPIGLVIAAVGSLGAALLDVTGAGAKAIAFLAQRFTALANHAIAAFQGIRDALVAGDFELAARILMLTLQLAVQKGVATLKSVWVSFKSFFITRAQEAFFGAKAAAEIAVHGIEVAWIEMTAFLSKTWTRFVSGSKRIWETFQTFLAKRFTEIMGLFDPELDVSAAKAQLDRDLANRLIQIDTQERDAIENREEIRSGQRELGRSEHERRLAEIGSEFDAAQQRLRDGADAEREVAESALAEARREWVEAINRAARERFDVESDAGSPGESSDLLARFEGLLGGISAAIENRIQSQGTFSAALAARLGTAGGSVAERTAKASEETARHTKRIADSAEQGGASFA